MPGPDLKRKSTFFLLFLGDPSTFNGGGKYGFFVEFTADRALKTEVDKKWRGKNQKITYFDDNR